MDVKYVVGNGGAFGKRCTQLDIQRQFGKFGIFYSNEMISGTDEERLSYSKKYKNTQKEEYGDNANDKITAS